MKPQRISDANLQFGFWFAEIIAVGCIAFIPHLGSNKEMYRYYFVNPKPTLEGIAYLTAFQLSTYFLLIGGIVLFALGRLRGRAIFWTLSGGLSLLIYFALTND